MRISYSVTIEAVTVEGRGVPFSPRTMYEVRDQWDGAPTYSARRCWTRYAALRLAAEALDIKRRMADQLRDDVIGFAMLPARADGIVPVHGFNLEALPPAMWPKPLPHVPAWERDITSCLGVPTRLLDVNV